MHGFGPKCRSVDNHPAPVQQVISTPFNDMAFATVKMGRIGGELSWFGQRMQRDLLPTRVIKPQEPCFCRTQTWRPTYSGGAE